MEGSYGSATRPHLTWRFPPQSNHRQVNQIARKYKIQKLYLFAIPPFVLLPGVHTRSPIFQSVLLGVFLATTVIEPTLRLNSTNHMHSTQIDLQILANIVLDLLFWTPSSTRFLDSQSVNIKKNIEFCILSRLKWNRRGTFCLSVFIIELLRDAIKQK